MNAVAMPAAENTQFTLTPKQQAAQRVLSGFATHCMLFGGSRSGKTFLLVRNVVLRALKAPHSKHLILRFRFNQCKTHIAMGTFPDVMRKAFPGIDYVMSRTDWFVTLPNGSEIWFGGLDDKERTEKILGAEYATVYFNECSQISFSAREMAITRLAQHVMQEIDGTQSVPLKLRAYYDCNPPSKAHWTFKLFKQKMKPDDKGQPVSDPDNYVSFQINPKDNEGNISSEYFATLAGLSGRMRRRFEQGEFSDATPNALFDEAHIDRWRVEKPWFHLTRVVVGVDPSGSGDVDNADNDEIGIVVAAMGSDGVAYVLEDASLKAGPGTWGKMAVGCYDRHQANLIVGEVNYGGDMVRATIHTARPSVPFKPVTATRGKAVRAEPFSALYEQGKVRHVGIMAKLEDELCALTTNGYTGEGSPNRADALIWALAELFPNMILPSGGAGEFKAIQSTMMEAF